MAQAGEIPVYGKLVSETTSHILAGADQIKDETANKMQSTINSEVQQTLEEVRNIAEAALIL